MRSSVKRPDSAAPPTRIGTPMPAAARSSAVTTIWCADLTSRPERPTASGRCSRTAATRASGGTLMPRSTTSKPLFAKMISTRFLPMSWTSPLTVASTTLPRALVVSASMNCSRWETAAFMASALCSTSATMSWLSLKSRPTSAMPAIRGPLITSSGAAPSASLRSRSSRSPLRLPSTI